MTRAAPPQRNRVATHALAIGLVGLFAMAISCAIRSPMLVMWNASPSVPIGLYAVNPGAELRRGDLAVTWLPDPPRAFAEARNYLPGSVPLIKPVASLGGSQVCRSGTSISIDGWWQGEALTVDRFNRPLPVWQGCRNVAPTEIFLMNARVPDSFDGRYFGPSDRKLVIGRAIPLLTFSTSSHRQSPKS